MQPIQTSPRLVNVRYEIRGALVRRARELEAAGRKITYLNIGNPGRFGFRVPEALTAAVRERLQDSAPYGHEQGLAQARAAIVAQQLARGTRGVEPDYVFVGNGVSELIDISLRALLKPGDEVLLPSPDYPLWSASTYLNRGQPVYYRCPASRSHFPDPDEIETLITARTRAIVLINPNNPTGAVYPRELLERIVDIAARHGLLLLGDEIYDGITYDDTPFQPLAPLAGDLPCITFSGLSKIHRACGYRVGWMTLSGDHRLTSGYRDALQLLAGLRVCPNGIAQWAVAPAIEHDHSIRELTRAGGRLHETRQAMIQGVKASRYLDMVAPKGSIYGFPFVPAAALPVFDDGEFAMRLLEEESVLLSPGTSFNLSASRHVRLTLLPEPEQMAGVFACMDRTLARMAERLHQPLSATAM